MHNFIKIEIGNFKIKNSEFAFYYDGEYKKMHILDLDQEGRQTVTNAVCGEFFDHIDAHLRIHYNEPASWEEYDVYLYHTDGLISEFSPETNQFKHIDPWDGHIYEPFKKICNERFLDLNIK